MVGKNHVLLFILSGYLIFGIGYAVVTPQWQNPDEPAHYNYIHQLAATKRLPVLEHADYNQTYLELIIRHGFPPELEIDSLNYESHQPPFYYLLALPVYYLGHGQVLPLRFFSLTIGACLIVVAYLICCTIAPNQDTLAYSTAVFIALLPQHTAMMASINNDALAELLMALVLWLALRERLGLSTGRLERSLLGLIVGLTFLTKLTVVISYPVAAFALLRRLQYDHKQSIQGNRVLHAKNAFIDLFLILVLPLLLASPWWLRNLLLYGWPDCLGMIRHASVVALQPQTGEWIVVNGFLGWFSRLLTFTFQSFWGQFGWMAVPMQPFIYTIIFFFCAVLIGNWFTARIQGSKNSIHNLEKGATEILFISTCLTLLAYLSYNVRFVQHQGRYLYSAIVPISLAIALSWKSLIHRLRFHYRYFSFSVLASLLVCLNLYVLYAVLQPHGW